MSKILVKEEEQKEKRFYRQLYIILGVGCILYFLFPFVFNVSYVDNKELWESVMRMLLIGVYPFYVFMACFMNTRYYGFRWYVPVMIGGYFIPAAIMMFGASAVPYAFAYMVFGFFGSLGAIMLLKRIERIKNKSKKEKFNNEKSSKRRGKFKS